MKRCLRCDAAFDDLGWRCPRCDFSPRMLDGYPAFAAQSAADGEGFDARLFERLAEAEPRSFWFANRTQVLLWALRECFPGAASLLEVGCGTGFVLAGLREARPELRLTGTELSLAGLEIARSRVGESVELLQADARAVPYRDEFDVVGAFDVLEHVQEDQVAVAELARATRPEGGILVTVPQHPRLWSSEDELAQHQRRYTKRGMLQLLSSAGLRPVLVTSFVSLPLPLLAASRLRRRRTRDVIDDLIPPRFADRALRTVLALERAAIGAGVRLPLGGSLLVAARK
jgi:SAM-dependent methyltransferase